MSEPDSWIQSAQPWISLGGLIATLFLLIAVLCTLVITQRGLRHATNASTNAFILQHDWSLFEKKVDPGLPGLPRMKDDDEYWRWRMIHLDHLKLLNLVWANQKVYGKKGVLGWQSWAGLLLEELKKDRARAIEGMSLAANVKPKPQDLLDYPHISRRLKALLDISYTHNWDVFPAGFVKWLNEECNFTSLDLPYKN